MKNLVIVPIYECFQSMRGLIQIQMDMHGWSNVGIITMIDNSIGHTLANLCPTLRMNVTS